MANSRELTFERTELLMSDAQTEETAAESIEGELVDSGAMLATLSKAEIDIQISTAKQYPRSIKKFKQQAGELATLDAETAGSMFYTLPRGGKRIEGPSVRLAEIVGSSWGNLRYGARVIDIGTSFVTAQGMAFDMEKNLASTIEVRRRITNKNGQRYADDMITVTANAAMSIALRNAIFKVVPFALVKGIFEDAKKTSLGKGLTMEQRRDNAMRAFAKFGAKPEEVCQVVGRSGADDLTIEDLITLKGMETAIKDGDTTWKEVLQESRADRAERTRGPLPSDILKEEKKEAGSNGKEANPQQTQKDAEVGNKASPSPSPGTETTQGAGAQAESAVQPDPAPASQREPGDEPEDSFETEAEKAAAFAIETIGPERLKVLEGTAASAGLGPVEISDLLKEFEIGGFEQVTNQLFGPVLGKLAKLPPKRGKK
jgi:hypothetical protein